MIAHKNPEQFIRLLKQLDTADSLFFIHVDKKSDITSFKKAEEVIGANKITWLKRRSIAWGGFNLVNITLDGMRKILDIQQPISHVSLLSGMDYPLQPISSYHNFLLSNPEKDYLKWSEMSADGPNSDILERILYHHIIFPKFRLAYPPVSYINYKVRNKQGFWWQVLKNITSVLPKQKHLPRQYINGQIPYKGSQWWTLSINTVKNIMQFLMQDKQHTRYFKYTLIADEFFFQSLMMNNPINSRDNMVNDNLRFIEWDIYTTGHPNTFGVKDYDKLVASNAFFARKFDDNIDSEILTLIDKNLLK